MVIGVAACEEYKIRVAVVKGHGRRGTLPSAKLAITGWSDNGPESFRRRPPYLETIWSFSGPESRCTTD
jgi:hypothetical protein